MKNTKVRLFVFVSIPVLIVSSIMMIIYFISNADTYQSIKIFEINGEVYIEREESENNEKVTPYENMNLTSGDRIVAQGNSSAKIKLDDSKYMLIEPQSVVRVDKASETEYSISVEKGAVITEIQKKLDKNSTYEINTPNATMAVRGTVFRVAISENSVGKLVTNLQVYEGKVEMSLSGKADSSVMIDKGMEAQAVGTDDDVKYDYTDHDVNVSSLPEVSLKYLVSIAEGGRELSIPKDKFVAMIEESTDTSCTDSKGLIKSADASVTGAVSETKSVESGNANENHSEATVPQAAADNNSQAVPAPTVPDNSNSGGNTTAANPQTSPSKPAETEPQVVQTAPPEMAEPVVTQAETSAEKVTVTIVWGKGYTDYITQVNAGSAISFPNIATSPDGQTLEGFYTDSSYINKWDKSSSVSSSMTLYAKWQ